MLQLLFEDRSFMSVCILFTNSYKHKYTCISTYKHDTEKYLVNRQNFKTLGTCIVCPKPSKKEEEKETDCSQTKKLCPGSRSMVPNLFWPKSHLGISKILMPPCEFPYSVCYSKPRGARHVYAPSKYCHAPPVGAYAPCWE